MPLALKIAPDLDDEQINVIAELLQKYGIDAVIATNTTVARDGVGALRHGSEAGGLSGAPVKARATYVVRELARALRGAIPVIGVGGIFSAADAREKISAGASLVQLYTGLIYKGPALVTECVKALWKRPLAPRRIHREATAHLVFAGRCDRRGPAANTMRQVRLRGLPSLRRGDCSRHC